MCACICIVKPLCLEFLLSPMTPSRIYHKRELHVFLGQNEISLKYVMFHVPIYTLLCHVGESLNKDCGQEETWNKHRLPLTRSLRLHDYLIKGIIWMLGLMLRNYIPFLSYFFPLCFFSLFSPFYRNISSKINLLFQKVHMTNHTC